MVQLVRRPEQRSSRNLPFGMRAPATLLAVLCILVGLMPALLVEHIVNSTDSCQYPTVGSLKARIWPFGMALIFPC